MISQSITTSTSDYNSNFCELMEMLEWVDMFFVCNVNSFVVEVSNSLWITWMTRMCWYWVSTSSYTATAKLFLAGSRFFCSLFSSGIPQCWCIWTLCVKLNLRCGLEAWYSTQLYLTLNPHQLNLDHVSHACIRHASYQPVGGKLAKPQTCLSW